MDSQQPDFRAGAQLIDVASEPFPISEKARLFKERFYPQASLAQWNDWHWQIRHRIKDLEGISRILVLSDDESLAIHSHQGSLPLGVTPYYAHLLDRHDADQGLRRTHMPSLAEQVSSLGEMDDPLAEDDDMVAPGIVHRYPDRVLFLTTGFCATYCRYCTRSRLVGHPGGEYSFQPSQWQQSLNYLRAHEEIRDVSLSGGDPLTLSDAMLDGLLARLRDIPHIEMVRFGSKVPIVLPQRITPELALILRRHRVWLSIHATHPDELTDEVAHACNRLADAGIPLGSQTVLLKGVNDNVPTMKALMHGLLKIRVRPYYLYQCDPIKGSSHFRTPVEKGIEIIAGLQGYTSGYAVPKFVVDAPGGGGKIPLLPEYRVGREGDNLLLRNYEGTVCRYPDPQPL